MGLLWISSIISSVSLAPTLVVMARENNTTVYIVNVSVIYLVKDGNKLSFWRHVFIITHTQAVSKLNTLFSDELGRVRLRHGPLPGSDYINASFIDVRRAATPTDHVTDPPLHRATSRGRHT